MLQRRRIVVGGDTSPSASAALRWAVQEASRTPGSTVVVVHAFDVEGRADLALERDLDRSRRDARYRTQAWVVEILGDCDLCVPVLVQTPDGSVEDALVQAARDAAMVVVGEPQNGRRQHLSAVLQERCPCPVVTVGAQSAAPLLSAGSTFSPYAASISR